MVNSRLKKLGLLMQANAWFCTRAEAKPPIPRTLMHLGGSYANHQNAGDDSVRLF